MSKSPVVFETVFDFPEADRALLFEACVSERDLRGWFAEHAEVEGRVGGRYAFWGKFTPWVATKAHADQRLTQWMPGRAIAFNWTWRNCSGVVEVRFEDAKDGGPGARIEVRHRVDGRLLKDEAETHWAIGDFWRLSMGNLGEYLRSGHAALRPDFGATSPIIELAIEIEATPAQVFAALVEPAKLDRWIASAAKVDARIGGEYGYGWSITCEGEPVPCGPTRVLALESGRVLVTDWLHGDEPQSRVEWQLTPLAGGTRTHLCLVHRRADSAEPTRTGYVQGWSAYLVRLKDFASGRSVVRV